MSGKWSEQARLRVAERRRARADNPERIKVRFLSKVDRGGPIPHRRPELGRCWLWTAYSLPSGYGTFNAWARRGLLAHRVSYEIFVGPIPDGFQVDHLCVNPRCVNPVHLEAVTGLENNRRSNSISARHARKSHCKNGHPFDEANTRVSKRGGRECRTCHRERAREARRMRREAEAR